MPFLQALSWKQAGLTVEYLFATRVLQLSVSFPFIALFLKNHFHSYARDQIYVTAQTNITQHDHLALYLKPICSLQLVRHGNPLLHNAHENVLEILWYNDKIGQEHLNNFHETGYPSCTTVLSLNSMFQSSHYRAITEKLGQGRPTVVEIQSLP